MQTALAPRRPARAAKVGAAVLAVLAVAGLFGYLIRPGASGDSGRAGDVSSAIAEAEVGQPAPAPTQFEAASDQSISSSNRSSQSEALPEISAAAIPGDVSRVIRTADLTVVIGRDGFADAFQSATLVAERLGGFVTYSNAQERSGTLTIRVPADDFNIARAELKDLGVRTQSESIQGQDVTAEFVDLKARLEILQARKDALVTLLHDASTLPTILRLQNEVDGVLTQIEQLKGQVHLINDQASLATITVTMREEGVTGPAPVDTPSLVQAWRSAVAGTVQVLAFVIVGLGYLLPIAAFGAVAWMVTRTVRGRRKTPAATQG